MIYDENIEFRNAFEHTTTASFVEKLIEPTDTIIDNMGNVRIRSSDWVRYNKKYSKSTIIRLISRAIDTHKVPFPHEKISKHSMQTAFRKLKESRSKDFLVRGRVFSRFDYRWRIHDLYIDTTHTYNAASNYFHQHSRYQAKGTKHTSPIDAWNVERQREILLKNLWSMPRSAINSAELRRAINLRMYVASQFKPMAAKVFYDLMNAKHVLDPSSGWGDRLCGFCASAAESYTGIDPNTRLVDGYKKQIETYGKCKDITMICTGSELYNPRGKKFDTIFTSPPYFNLEEYSDDKDQSFLRYDTFDAWYRKFLCPTLDTAWKSLDTSHPQRGGILCINISDVITQGERRFICDSLNDYLSKKKGARYLGAIGLRLSLRPNIVTENSASKDAAFIEPMWLWAKDGTWEIDDYIKNGFANSSAKVGLFR